MHQDIFLSFLLLVFCFAFVLLYSEAHVFLCLTKYKMVITIWLNALPHWASPPKRRKGALSSEGLIIILSGYINQWGGDRVNKHTYWHYADFPNRMWNKSEIREKEKGRRGKGRKRGNAFHQIVNSHFVFRVSPVPIPQSIQGPLNESTHATPLWLCNKTQMICI